MQESLEQPNSNIIISEKREKKKKPKQNFKQYETSSVAGGLNMI